jgi:hypothetical protein
MRSTCLAWYTRARINLKLEDRSGVEAHGSRPSLIEILYPLQSTDVYRECIYTERDVQILVVACCRGSDPEFSAVQSTKGHVSG